jgi:regulator of RNase E activity RraA
MDDSAALFEHLGKFDTPTICNAIEVALGGRFTTGFTRRTLIASRPKLAPIVGYARTLTVRCSVPFDAAGRKQRLLGYYAYLEQEPRPTVAVVQDVDSQPGLGAFWGEVNTTVHWGLGCVGAVTDGSMRDLDMMHPQFQCLAATLSPSHAYIQVLEYGQPVDVLGMLVAHGDVVHADYHGAVVIPAAALDKLPAAIDLMARREKVILDAARQPGFSAAKMEQAMAAMDRVK